MLIWSGKNYGHGQGKSGNLILHKEWEPWFSCVAFRVTVTVVLVLLTTTNDQTHDV